MTAHEKTSFAQCPYIKIKGEVFVLFLAEINCQITRIIIFIRLTDPITKKKQFKGHNKKIFFNLFEIH